MTLVNHSGLLVFETVQVTHWAACVLVITYSVTPQASYPDWCSDFLQVYSWSDRDNSQGGTEIVVLSQGKKKPSLPLWSHPALVKFSIASLVFDWKQQWWKHPEWVCGASDLMTILNLWARVSPLGLMTLTQPYSHYLLFKPHRLFRYFTLVKVSVSQILLQTKILHSNFYKYVSKHSALKCAP